MATRRAHILWQWYLKNFTDTWTKEWKVFCYNLEKIQYIDNQWVSTKWLWWRSCTYSQRDLQAKKRDDEIEQEFSHIENNVTSWIDTIISILNNIQTPWDIIDRKKINEDDIINFILLLINKTVWERAINHQWVINELAKRFNELCQDLLTNQELIMKLWKEEIEQDIKKWILNDEKLNNEISIQEYWKEKIKEIINQQKENFYPENEAKELFSNLLISEEYQPIFIRALKEKNWMFSYIRNEEYDFCVSDFPIYLRPDNDNLASFSKNPSVEITIPLSKKILLTIGWNFESKRQYTILTSHAELIKLIKQANQMLIANATRYVAWSKKIFVDELIKSKEENKYEANFFSSINKILSSIQKN